MTDLAKRAVACKRWRWLPGAALMCDTLQGKSVTRGTRAIGRQRQHPMGIGCVCDAINLDGDRGGYVGALPDLTDPATLGCLLALVREAWSDPHVCPRSRTTCIDGENWTTGPWDVASTSYNACMTIACGQTEAEALVAALEIAP